MKKLGRQIDLKKSELERHEAEVSKALAEAKVSTFFFSYSFSLFTFLLFGGLYHSFNKTIQEIVSAIENRGLKIGKAMFQELTGLKKPVLDKNNILHWPVLLLYAEVMSSDFIEDFCETDMFSVHLDMISFSLMCFLCK